MKDNYKFIVILVSVWMLILFYQNVQAQQNLAQEAYAIFEQSCLICHGENGSYTEALIIEHTALIDDGKVVPGDPDSSVFYQRLIETNLAKRMPLGQPALDPEAIETIRQWIAAGAPDWSDIPRPDTGFITTEVMLQTIENHVNSLSPRDKLFARYFTLTHIYNAGETVEALNAYRRALSKLINSLSWGRDVVKPQSIDVEETVFYIDLRDYEWDVRNDAWTQIEQVYPYQMTFDAPTQTHLRDKLTTLQQEMNCEVPFVHIDWFLATASLPPLYNDILDLPETDRELEAALDVYVAENLQNAPGKRVWRAGFNESGVSRHNRVVERHISRYGAYWKSYDFAGSAESQNIFTHPLDFTHDGGEIIFNLPNGLQAYYLVDANGGRLDVAPTDIVSNPAASDPAVRNGLSCIGCHTEGMKTFEDEVRAAVEQADNPPFNKERVLDLYVQKAVMDDLVKEDTQRYRAALEAAGGVFGGIEPVQRFHEAFQGPLDAAHAAASVGFETDVFLEKISKNVSLQNLLGALVLENGAIKRDAWTSGFHDVISALDSPDSVLPPVVQRPERIPGAGVHIPDVNLRAAIEETLSKAAGDVITVEDMATLTTLWAYNRDITDLTGIEHAVNLEELSLLENLLSDISPLAELTELQELNLGNLNPGGNRIFDISSLAGLTKLQTLDLRSNPISDISPLSGLINLENLQLGAMYHSTGNVFERFRTTQGVLSDISPLAGLTKLRVMSLNNNSISDISPLSTLINLELLGLHFNNISDVSSLANLQKLRGTLNLLGNNISDVSPLANLQKLIALQLQYNRISDISPLDGLPEHTRVFWYSNPGFPQGGPKIEGPWLWVLLRYISPLDFLVSSEHQGFERNLDFLSEASEGTVTEQAIAANGAAEGSPVGEHVWTSHKIEPTNADKFGDRGNIWKMLSAMGFTGLNGSGNIVYGLTYLYSPREQKTNMFAGSSAAHKVWLNGELVRDWKVRDRIYDLYTDYEDFFPVTLKQGQNILLVGVEHGYGNRGRWRFSGDFGFAPGTEYTASIPGVDYTFSHPKIYVGGTFTLNLSARNVIDLAGWQGDITFDPDALEAVEVTEGDFLKSEGEGTFFQAGTIDNAAGKITSLYSARISESGVNGTGTLLSVTYKAKADGETQVTLENFEFSSISGDVIPAVPPNITITVGDYPAWDVNQDGRVSIQDLVLVAKDFGSGAPANLRTDVNRDGVINIQDLILVAQHFGESTDTAAPAIFAMDSEELTPTTVQTWIDQAQFEDDGSLAFRQGIENLQRLLALLIPQKTALLANYPNPFNPETWIPYQLAKPADVTLTIYAASGAVVRTLALGHQAAGIYQSRNRAAYWDGRNNVGESVASGIYFYTLTTGDWTATRRMLILK